jgi:hypothetical protein
VCDADCMINDINCMMPLYSGVALCFAQSRTSCCSGTTQSEVSNGVTVFPMIVGDSAYPQLSFTMKAFHDRSDPRATSDVRKF